MCCRTVWEPRETTHVRAMGVIKGLTGYGLHSNVVRHAGACCARSDSGSARGARGEVGVTPDGCKDARCVRPVVPATGFRGWGCMGGRTDPPRSGSSWINAA